MTVDDYDEAISLNNRLDASVPFKVRPGKQMLKNMQAQGKSVKDQNYTVEKVLYGGDEGGITCVLKGKATDKEIVASSITHLIIDPEHPLADEVKAYQQKRTRRLFLQDQRGFAAMMGEAKTAKKKKKKRSSGFG
ncbi:MAG: hypothetical protein AAGA83_07960 [Cyanobacteria bacterium P01_F01_bin.116]